MISKWFALDGHWSGLWPGGFCCSFVHLTRNRQSVDLSGTLGFHLRSREKPLLRRSFGQGRPRRTLLAQARLGVLLISETTKKTSGLWVAQGLHQHIPMPMATSDSGALHKDGHDRLIGTCSENVGCSNGSLGPEPNLYGLIFVWLTVVHLFLELLGLLERHRNNL